MSYLSLKKYEYNNHGDLLNEYERRFNCYDSKHIGIDINSYPAFFVESKEIRKSVLHLHKMDKEVMRLCGELPSEALMQYMLKCLMDEIQITNSIEGVQSTKKEIRAAYENRGKRFKGIVDKYRLLMSDKEIRIKNCKDVRVLYDDLVLQEVLEESPQDKPDGKFFRKGHVHVYGRMLEPIHEGLYPEERIIHSMNQALAYLNDDEEEILYRIAVFHYLLGYIHPFYNGNGRLNRFISSYMLTREFEPLLGYRLSYTVMEEQSSYNKAFVECNDEDNRGELTMFVEMFLRIITESMENLIRALRKRSMLWKKYTGYIVKLPFGNEKNYPKVYEELILHELFSSDGVSISELETATGMSVPTLRKVLNTIQKNGLLKIDKTGRHFVYGLDLKKLDQLISEAE